MFPLIQRKILALARGLKAGGGGRAALAVLLCFTLAIGFLLGQAAKASIPPVPGSEDDPLVTVSWVEARLRALSTGEGLPSGTQPVSISAPALTFKIVNIPAGKKITGSGTEVILRSGKARAVAGSGGGLADLTAGRDLASGEAIKANHLLLLIREDGRGIEMETEAIFLVRGDYKIE